MLCPGDHDPHLHECIRYTCKITFNIDREIERNFSRVYISGGVQIFSKWGGGGRGGVVSVPRASFWSKNKGGRHLNKGGSGPSGPSAGSATVQYVKEFVRLTMILEFFPWYLSEWASPLLMAVLTLIGKPFIVDLVAYPIWDWNLR